MKKISVSFALLVSVVFTNSSCSDYLDIVPDGVATIETTFSNRANAEKYLMTCYSYQPFVSSAHSNPGFLAGDEFWLYPKGTGFIDSRIGGLDCWEIGRGTQNSNDPYVDLWSGRGSNGRKLWTGIRDCNIFLENIHKPLDLQEYERVRWIAEVKFLKAFYHFYLMQMYGPIPIMDVNIDVNADIDKVRKHRDPLVDVVDYITTLIDECVVDLPPRITHGGTELGRITQPIALAVKAQALLFVASPLMNGNPDYVELTDNRGVRLFPQEYDQTKWEKAADAALAAIISAEEGGHRLFKYRDYGDMSDATRTMLGISGAVTENWNEEIIWGYTQGSHHLQTIAMSKLGAQNMYYEARSLLAPTLKIAEQFYSNNGVPISEDRGAFWSQNYTKRYDVVDIEDNQENRYKLEAGEQTANLHLNRELRFYANMSFDRGTWYNINTDDREGAYKIHARGNEYSGMASSEDYSITGYLPKKLININTTITNTEFRVTNYAFPIIRLADLYLIYAEALNESLSAPNDDVYRYLDSVRVRAGLNGVVESWTNHSIYPAEVRSKVGMRKIIRQERLNELSLEGQRFWDLRRWKIELDQKVYGWNIKGKTAEEFYRVTELFSRPRYYYRDYLWPIQVSTMQKNPNLVQNPGWN